MCGMCVSLHCVHHRLEDFGVVFNKMLNTCGHPANGVVTPCTVRALSTTTVQSTAVEAGSMVTATQSEEVFTGVEPALVAAETTTGTIKVASGAGVEPIGSSVNAAASVATPLASEESVMPDVGVPVVMQQAMQVPGAGAVDGGN